MVICNLHCINGHSTATNCIFWREINFSAEHGAMIDQILGPHMYKHIKYKRIQTSMWSICTRSVCLPDSGLDFALDSVWDLAVFSSSLAVLRLPRAIASSNGPGSLTPVSAPLAEQEQFTMHKHAAYKTIPLTAITLDSCLVWQVTLRCHLSPSCQ